MHARLGRGNSFSTLSLLCCVRTCITHSSVQEKFLKAELPNFAETCLSASCTDPEVQAGINTFLEKCHEVCFGFLICREVVVDPLFSLPFRVVAGVCLDQRV
jgi:hypothetical protein